MAIERNGPALRRSAKDRAKDQRQSLAFLVSKPIDLQQDFTANVRGWLA